jgi:hypothetical protein
MVHMIYRIQLQHIKMYQGCTKNAYFYENAKMVHSWYMLNNSITER